MYMIAIAAVVLGMPFLLAWHYRKAARRLAFADKAWGSLEYHANQLFQDKTVPVEVGDFVEFVVGRTGDGMMTRSFLFGLIWRGRSNGDSTIVKAVNALNPGQDQHFNRFVIDALLYDSLRTTISGALLRRILYWLVTTAADEKVSVSDPQVLPIAKAASRAYGLTPCVAIA